MSNTKRDIASGQTICQTIDGTNPSAKDLLQPGNLINLPNRISFFLDMKVWTDPFDRKKQS